MLTFPSPRSICPRRVLAQNTANALIVEPYLDRDVRVTVHWREMADAVVDRDAARERDALLHLLVLLERLQLRMIHN